MFKVNEVNKSNDLGPAKAKKNVSGESFSSYLKGPSAAETSQVSGTAGIAVSEAIFAAQLVNDEEEKAKKKQVVKRGQSLLGKLEEIRDGLLLGYISRDKLIEISRFVKDRRTTSNDPQLEALIDEIELRVEVELAKLTR